MGLISGTSFSSSAGVNITGGAANTVGTNSQLIASTSADAVGLWVTLRPQTTNRHTLLTINTGASAGTPIGDPIYVRAQVNSACIPFFIPIAIPSGTRLGASLQDSGGSAQVVVSAMLQEANVIFPMGATGMQTYPAPNTGTSEAVATVDAGGTINTFSGTAGNLSASTSADANCFTLQLRDQVSANVDFAVQLKIGSTVIMTTQYKRGASGSGSTTTFGPFFHSIPAGSELTCEISCSGNTVGSRELAVTAYLFNIPTPSTGGAGRLVGTGGLV